MLQNLSKTIAIKILQHRKIRKLLDPSIASKLFPNTFLISHLDKYHVANTAK